MPLYMSLHLHALVLARVRNLTKLAARSTLQVGHTLNSQAKPSQAIKPSNQATNARQTIVSDTCVYMDDVNISVHDGGRACKHMAA